MAEPEKIKFSKSDLETLHHLSNLLHLFHHRNKNQHRRSIWWRHFSTFRRQLNSLLSEVQSLHEVPTTHLQRSRKKAQDRETRQAISNRLEFWKDVGVPKWHTSFSQIVADGRFAVLGLVLLAILAQACHISGINSGMNEAEVVEAEKGLQNLPEVPEDATANIMQLSAPHEEDVGEVINREEVVDNSNTTEAPERTSIEEPRTSIERSASSNVKPTLDRKRRRKGNTIDDLFSCLD